MKKQMKVLWSVNVIIREAAEVMGIQPEMSVTWLDHLIGLMKRFVVLSVVFPTERVDRVSQFEGEGVSFIAIPKKNANSFGSEDELTKYYLEVFEQVKPDVIHQWGTEFPHVLNMIQAATAAGLIDYVVVSIQGLIGVLGQEENFYAGLPERIIKKHSFKDLLRKNSLKEYRSKFLANAEYETKVLKRVKHVIGRTTFDREETRRINPSLQYHHNNETLRNIFYESRWSLEKCVSHRVFISQGGMPYKGFHLALDGLSKLLMEYPNLTIHVTGRNLGPTASINEKIRYSAYEQYIHKKIKEQGWKDRVVFLGKLNAEEMKEQYLQANVFLLPSTIENSPNSLGEAMLLGVPAVSADVGGVRDLIRPDEEGLLYPWDDIDQMVKQVRSVFCATEEELVKRTENARKHALSTHDPKKNLSELIDIYQQIAN